MTLVADSRLLSRPSPTLWAGRVPEQVFAIELHSEYPRSGPPGLVSTNLIPDVHHFRGSGGGRALPKLHPDGTANVADGLLAALEAHFGHEVTGEDVFAYVAEITAHPGFVAQFDDELHTPGVRVPLTADWALFERGCVLGQHVQWLHTFGEAGIHPDGYTNVRDQRIGVQHPSHAVPVGPAVPRDWSYEEGTRRLHVGSGCWDGVAVEVTAYTVGGTRVLDSWLGYRLAEPRKRGGTALDEINAVQWDPSWSIQLTNLLSVLTQLIALEDQMNDVLQDIVVGPLLTRSALAERGVTWPATDRRPPDAASRNPARVAGTESE